MSRRIVIDYRESKLIDKLQGRIQFQRDNLAVADIILYEGDVPRILIERKSLSDLSQSIKDTRFREQKRRMMDYSQQSRPPAKIAYWVEGPLPPLTMKVSNLPVKTIYGAMINCIYRDNLTLYKTKDISETADLLVILGTKFLSAQEPFKVFSENKDSTNAFPLQQSAPVAKKRGDFTALEGFQRILCQIPSISMTKAQAISSAYVSLQELVQTLGQETGENELETCKKRRSKLSDIRLPNGSKLGPATSQKILYFFGFSEFQKIPVEPKKKSLLNT